MSERLPALQWICVRSVDDARQALPVLGMLATEHCPQAMEPLRRVENNLNKIYDAATRDEQTPTTPPPGGGGKTLGDDLRELSRQANELAEKQPVQLYIARAYEQVARRADARGRLLLALVADLRAESTAAYAEMENQFGRGLTDAADRIEAALRGDGGKQ